MSRNAAVVLCLALLTSACAGVGADTPSCEQEGLDVRVSLIMSAQAVPTAELGPCLNELKAGWSHDVLEAESGRVRLALNSDRLGDEFLVITLEEICDPEDAQPQDSGREDVQRWVDVREGTSGPVEITFVPVTEAEVLHTANLALSLTDLFIRERPVIWDVDDGPAETEQRIAAALAKGHYAMVVSTADLQADEVELRTPGGQIFLDEPFDDALDIIKGQLDIPTYVATWYHRFEGGCIVYDFDARGPGIDQITADVAAAVGYFPLGEFRRAAARAGVLVVDEG